MKGGHAIVQILKKEGIPFVAGVIGGSLHEIADALYDTPEIKAILVRHERAGVDMADGYARVSGRPGVAAAVQGPGAAHAVAGIANSYADSTPVLLLQGQVSHQRMGTQTLQEMNLLDVYRTMTKWQSTIPTPERIPEIFRRAFTIIEAGRPGPVVVEIPTDIAQSDVDDALIEGYLPIRRKFRPRPEPEDVERAADLLVRAERPVLLAGAGVLYGDATQELRELAETLSAPVMNTLTAKGAFPENHPLSLGLGGFPLNLFGTKQAHAFSRSADVVLAVGNSFKPAATRGVAKPTTTKLIHVTCDPTELNKIHQAEVPMLGDAKLALADILAAVKDRLPAGKRGMRGEVVEEVRGLKEEWLREWMPSLTSSEAPINPYRLTWEFMHIVDPDSTIVLHDSGSVRGYICHHYESTQPRGFLGFGGQSAMGWSMGAAMGAKLAAPHKLVVNFIGDGSFGMTGMDFETAVRCHIPILTIVVNNLALNMSMETRRQQFAERYIWVELSGNYAEVAHGLGGWSDRVTEPAEIAPALRRAIEATENGGPALLEVMCKRLVPEPIMPDPKGEAGGRTALTYARPAGVQG